jgi:hypothetical protein
MSTTMINKYENHIFEDLIYEPKRDVLIHKQIEIPWKMIFIMGSKRRNRRKKSNWKPYTYQAVYVIDVEDVECEIRKYKLDKMLKYIWKVNKKGKLIKLNI